MKRKYALDSYAKAGLPDCYRLANAGVFSGNYHAFKYLNPLFVALFDFYVNANGIAGLELGDIIAELSSFNIFNYWVHVYTSVLKVYSQSGAH